MSKPQIHFNISGHLFKVEAHATDGDQLVIKSAFSTTGALMAAAMDVPVLSAGKGSKYFLTFVPRAAFLANMGTLTQGVLTGKIQFMDVVPAGPEDEDEPDGDEDGEDSDGDGDGEDS